MLDRPIQDVRSSCESHRVRQDRHGLNPRPLRLREGAIHLVRICQWQRNDRHSELPSGLFRPFEPQDSGLVGGIPEHRNADQRWDQLLENLQPLAGELPMHERDVATLDIAELCEATLERCHSLRGVVRHRGVQCPDPVHFPSRLRLSGDRRSERPGQRVSRKPRRSTIRLPDPPAPAPTAGS